MRIFLMASFVTMMCATFAGADEATVNPDGSTTFENGGGGGGESAHAAPEDGSGDASGSGGNGTDSESSDGAEAIKNTDPAMYLAVAVVAFLALYALATWRRKKSASDVDDFFDNLDGDKFNLKLPAAADEYYTVKNKCEEEGWIPGQPPSYPAGQQPPPNSPHRLLAQALMKRCIADIPIVQHIQRESPGMNKLYSQSMCSVRQWQSYQAAEAMVSAEVEEVRAEADEVEPGWSQVIWRQAMQYHNMLKQKQETEEKQRKTQAEAVDKQRRAIEQKAQAERARYDAVKRKVDAEKARIALAEKTATDLIKQEEREREGKKAFREEKGGMKKGFLDAGKK